MLRLLLRTWHIEYAPPTTSNLAYWICSVNYFKSCILNMLMPILQYALKTSSNLIRPGNSIEHVQEDPTSCVRLIFKTVTKIETEQGREVMRSWKRRLKRRWNEDWNEDENDDWNEDWYVSWKLCFKMETKIENMLRTLLQI